MQEIYLQVMKGPRTLGNLRDVTWNEKLKNLFLQEKFKFTIFRRNYVYIWSKNRKLRIETPSGYLERHIVT